MDNGHKSTAPISWKGQNLKNKYFLTWSSQSMCILELSDYQTIKKTISSFN